jgi:predicted GNAT superfamily acetyltransferase
VRSSLRSLDKRNLRIRPLRKRPELEAAVELQKRVWGMRGEEAIPWSQMHVIARNGGVVLGAYDGKALVGFLMSQPAWDGRSVYLYSKMLGVLPGYRATGLGRALKRRQRREALRLGYDRVRWTFDPLERASAVLNLGYLGVRARRFLRDFYGPGGTARLHAGLPSDRLLAEWEIRSRHVAARARRREIPVDPSLPEVPVLVEHARLAAEPALTGPRPIGSHVRGGGVPLPALVAIPDRIQHLKRRHPDVARAWHRALRRVFSLALSAGGEVSDVRRHRRGGSLYDYYVLTRQDDAPAGGRRRR